MGLFDRKGISFQKAKLSESKINSSEKSSLIVNLKTSKAKFHDIVLKTSTDDENNQYLTIDNKGLSLPDLDFPNQTTGDHTIIITPHNVPLSKMLFKLKLQVFVNKQDKPILTKDFDLTVTKQ